MSLHGHLQIGPESIHPVTLFSLIVLSLVLLYRIKQPIAERLLSVAVYVCAAMMFYEVFWNIPWAFYYPHPFIFWIRDWIGFATILIMLLWTPKTLNANLHLEIPRVNWWRLIVLTIIMPFLILWIHSTGFYQRLVPFHLEQTLEDPHNIQIAISVMIGLLSWIFIPKPLKISNSKFT